MSYSFYIKVYGCQMNDYDGKRIEDILVLNGFTKEENPLNADIVIFYTCNIREKAVHKLESTIENNSCWWMCSSSRKRKYI